MLDKSRNMSPIPGCSTLITSAPKSASIVAAAGAAMTDAQSITLRPEKRYGVTGPVLAALALYQALAI